MLILNYFYYLHRIIESDLIIIKINGLKWIKSKSISFCLYEIDGFVIIIDCPCWVTANILSEYTAVKNLSRARIIIDEVDVDIIDVINIISLNRFSDGGAAIFTANSKNHHIDNEGVIDNNPLIK